MVWTIEIDPAVQKELRKFDPQWSKRILLFLFEKLKFLENPRGIGEPLKGKRYEFVWRYRYGDYRIFAYIEDEHKKILIVRIGHRKEIYD